MRRPLVGLVAAALLVSVTAACGSSDSAEPADSSGDGDTTTIDLAVIPIVDVAPIYLGVEQGFYEEQGIELNLVTAQGGAAIVPGVTSGQYQFGFSNVTSLMLAQSNNVPVKAVANGVASTGEDGADFGGIVVKGDSPLESAADLEGKKVAVNTLKNIGDTSVRESVRKAGGDPDAVEFVEMAFDQMPAALDQGQIDAAWVVEPALAVVKSQGGRVIASNFVDLAPDLTVAVYFASAEYAEKNPELVAKFQEATKASLAYADNNPDEVREILSSYTKIPADLLSEITLPKWPTEPNRASLDTLAELGANDGLFSTEPDLDALLP